MFVCAVQRKLQFWSPIKSKALMDVLGKRWWDKHMIVLEDQKVTWVLISTALCLAQQSSLFSGLYLCFLCHVQDFWHLCYSIAG